MDTTEPMDEEIEISEGATSNSQVKQQVYEYLFVVVLLDLIGDDVTDDDILNLDDSNSEFMVF